MIVTNLKTKSQKLAKMRRRSEPLTDKAVKLFEMAKKAMREQADVPTNKQ